MEENIKTPGLPSEITVDWLRKALEWKNPDCEPISAVVESVYDRPGLLGKIIRVKLTYADKSCGPLSFIVKFQICSDKEREAQIYRLLSEAKISSVPKLFGIFENGTLVLEDLSPAQPGSQVKGCTLEQVCNVLPVIAEIHGHFWQDTRVPLHQPEKFAKIIKYNVEQCWKSFRSRYKEIPGDVITDFEWVWQNTETVSHQYKSEPSTLNHGDLHAENLLFIENEKNRPILIDWQIADRKVAVFDISFFLVKSLDREQRRANERQLLKEYFELLPKQVRTDYGFDLFWLHYRACVTRSMLSAIMVIGPGFANRPDQYKLSDVLARCVIAAVKDLKPVEVIRELGENGWITLPIL
ncbi:MAG: phosphotransferase [Spirochaetales bacterium]|nr:phosphotransferase [Spirochaetales bacterium]